MVVFSLIARFMGPPWDPSGADRTQMGSMLAPWTLLSGEQVIYYMCVVSPIKYSHGCVFPDSKVHGANLGPTGPRWAPCWPHELYFLGCYTPMKMLREIYWFYSIRPSVHPSHMPCPLCGSLPVSWIILICGTNITHEGTMCCVPFPGQ